ncbi:Very-short-patch-repair endonuclease [Tistlia consotensis]|uniref:Very-short-patch-repair endonuclease n=1 Tax=Tistlia consotensis USBA 355 TaxID=560819 RepID=A0A1Y6B4X8_9PROT|nr:endonuclease domain-containing protein [Tistlia consotensis]SME92306.1 Very-short-patch-repair endonuclease [Tistlia consotensis USBA 355]SNR27967.1 Very-short-patch-repair endonuclease [Tistlia consotensis]
MVTSPRRTDFSRDSTVAERRLWYQLRRFQIDGVKFRRQHTIGPFVVDFVCPSGRLIIELDGGQHVAEAEADERRTRLLEGQGYRVIRFWNHEVMENIDGVLEAIARALRDVGDDGAGPSPEPAPPVRPLPEG